MLVRPVVFTVFCFFSESRGQREEKMEPCSRKTNLLKFFNKFFFLSLLALNISRKFDLTAR